MSYTYHFPTLWTGKSDTDVVTERHDIVLLFDATNCNPNGDPDTGNMPRLQPDTLHGLVTDVCLKRKVRNFFSQHQPSGQPRVEGSARDSADRYAVFIHENAVIQTNLESSAVRQRAKRLFNDWLAGDAFSAEQRTENRRLLDELLFDLNDNTYEVKPGSGIKGEDKKKAEKLKKDFADRFDRSFRDALADLFFDIRYFGAVASTEGPLKGSFYGQIRGPLQITFAESLDKILQLDFSITRCAVANEAEAEKKGDDNRTMGRKYMVPYGLYRCQIHFSPAFAVKTGFTYGDFDNFLFALTRCLGDYNVDGSSARPGGMRVVGLVDFQHSSALGNAPAHKLFDLVKVTGKKKSGSEPGSEVFASTGSEFPQGLCDYAGSAPDGDIYAETNKYGQVVACTTTKPAPKDGNQPVSQINARRLVWEIEETK
jgi:CRISPR-associated protein Csd2